MLAARASPQHGAPTATYHKLRAHAANLINLPPLKAVLGDGPT
jgi:hypothetical protein